MYSWLKWMGPSVLLAGLVGCTPPDSNGSTEMLNINPVSRSLDDKGGKTQLRVSAVDAAGNVGTGDVKLTTPAGFFDNAGKSITLTLDSAGTAATSFACPVAQDDACKGSVRIEGTWGAITSNVSIQVGGTVAPADGGSTPPTPDAGTTGDGGVYTPPPVTEAGKPANILFDTTGGTASELGIRSVGLRTATPVVFTVLDIEGKPVANATVSFSVTGPAGVSLVPAQKQTNSEGKANTVLQSGDEVGVATVSGSISPETGGTLTARTPAISIVGARVSDRGFVVECTQLVLSSNMTETPPHKAPSTTCTANVSDRFANPISGQTTVTWYSEAGAIASPVQSADGTSAATSTFSTAGKWPPMPVEPLVMPVSTTDEPKTVVRGVTYNPRDMLVTVIAVTSGEEEFYDGSGASNGVKNGQWDKGEWFVDTPEPFVDANDNQVYDNGEAFIDTERVNCDTGAVEPKNGRWDGPNGCWDGTTMLWHPTHILYSGYNSLDQATFEWYRPATPSVLIEPPTSVSRGGRFDLGFTIRDAYRNIISQSNPAITLSTAGTPGRAEFVKLVEPNLRTYGFQIIHERLETVPDSSRVGYRTTGAICDPSKPASGAGGDARLARCVWQYRFGRFETRTNSGTIRLYGANSTDDPGSLTVRLSSTDNYGGTFATFDVAMP